MPSLENRSTGDSPEKDEESPSLKDLEAYFDKTKSPLAEQILGLSGEDKKALDVGVLNPMGESYSIFKLADKINGKPKELSGLIESYAASDNQEEKTEIAKKLKTALEECQ